MTGPVPRARADRNPAEASRAGWQVLAQASDRGSAPFNEDIAGAAGAEAWIVDGSAFFSGPPRVAEISEGAWLVRAIDRRLRAAALDTMALSDVAEMLETGLAADYAALGKGQPERAPGEGPSAVFAFLRIRPQGELFHVDAMLLGDVSVLIEDAGRLTRWTDERVAPFEARTIATAQAAVRSDGVVIAPQALAQIIENRRSLNREGGYWAINPSLPWRPGLRFVSQLVSAQATLLLASDGFMRLVDVIRHYGEADLMQAVKDEGVGSLIAELRRLEREDGQARRFARVKIHDDATALVIQPAGGR